MKNWQMWYISRIENVAKLKSDCYSSYIADRKELEEHMRKNHVELPKKEKEEDAWINEDMEIWRYGSRDKKLVMRRENLEYMS